MAAMSPQEPFSEIRRCSQFNLRCAGSGWIGQSDGGLYCLEHDLPGDPSGGARGNGFPAIYDGLHAGGAGRPDLVHFEPLRGERLRIRAEAVTLAGSGLLLWLGGNGLVTFAEQHAASGLAALLVAASPMSAAVIEAIVDRKLPSVGLAVSLVGGFIGIALLTAPELLAGCAGHALRVGLIGRSAGVGERFGVASAPTGGVEPTNQFGISDDLWGDRVHGGGAAGRGTLSAATTEALLAWGYLVIFGSLFAFTAYVTALRLLPTSVVMTYAYVNPVLAVLLGAWLLGEEITIWTLAGSALVLLGVAGVFRARRLANKTQATKA